MSSILVDSSLDPGRQLDALLSETVDAAIERERSALDLILSKAAGSVVLMGAGSLGRSSARCLSRDGVRPLAFCDNNPAIWGTTVEGIPVRSPAEAAATYGTAAAFFVTIWGLNHRYVETRERLTAAGCKHVYPAAPLRWKYSDALLPFFLQDLPHKVYEEAAMVRAAFRLWNDDHSRQEYLAQVRYRALGDLLCLSAPDAEPSYFLDSLYSLQSNEVFIDCGAYDGDTLQEVLRRNQDCRVVALEPDPENFQAILRYVASLPPEVASRITVHPYAASSTRGLVRFSASGAENASISAAGDIEVEAVPLDELVLDLAPTFVKMDIEGAEVEALEGARRLIAAHHPLLSICLYHRQSDLWRIPLLIHSIYPGYRHYLRTHETEGWQTVGYAVPQERLKGTAPA